MKYNIKQFGMTIAMLLSIIHASAYDFEVDGIRYNVLSHTDFTVETTSSPNVMLTQNGDLEIPETVEYSGKSLSVIKIGEYSFQSLSDLKTVEMNGIEYIGDYAFYGCNSLISVSGESIKEVGAHSFDECTNLSNINFGKDIASIGEWSFAQCYSLKDFKQTNTIEQIGEYAFCNSGLSSIVLNDKITLGAFSFRGCENLKLVDFQHCVNPLSNGLFQDCFNLTELVNLDVPEILPPAVFQNCHNLNVEGILTSFNLKYISENSVSECYFPETLVILPGIERIDDNAFCGFAGNVDIQDSDVSLNVTEETFSNMEIYHLRIGRNLSTWKMYFPSSLNELFIGPMVTEIARPIECNPGNSYYSGNVPGGSPFVKCSNLTSVVIEPSGENLFISGVGKLQKSEVNKKDYSDWYYYDYYSGLFSECPIVKLSIGRNISSDKSTSYTFKHSDKYKTYKHYYWNEPFSGITTISQLDVDYNGFDYSPISSDLKYLTLGFHISEIPDLSICDIESLEIRTPYPPKACCFSSKSYLDCSVIIPYGQESEYRESDVWNNFWNIIENKDFLCSIRCDGLLYRVLSDNNLSVIKDKQEYNGNIKIPAQIEYENNIYTVTSISTDAFKDCSDLNSLSIPETVIHIGESVFSGCSLKELRFEDGNNPLMLSAGKYDTATSVQKKEVNGKTIQFKITYYKGIFDGLGIEKLYLGRNLSEMPRYTISGDGGVDYYNIVTYDNPFYNLPKLKELTIGENVSVLGPKEEVIEEINSLVTAGSFKKCSALEKVTVLNTVPPSGAEFSSTTYKYAEIDVPEYSVSQYQTADGWKEFVNYLICAESITIEPSSISEVEGTTVQLTATILPENVPSKEVAWSSSDDSVATVDETGVVSIVSEGSCIIYAKTTDGSDLTAECSVIGLPILAESIAIEPSTINEVEGTTVQLSTTILPENVSSKEIAWSSSDDSVATVDETGVVSIVSEGSCIIYAKTTDGSDLTAECSVIGLPMLAESIAVDPSTISEVEGTTVKLTATILPENVSSKEVAWRSSDDSVATVDEVGLVTIVSEGSCTIYAKTTDGSDLTAECFVTSVSGIEEIFGEEPTVDVYDINGKLILKDASVYDFKKLQRGLYIVNGKKVFKTTY